MTQFPKKSLRILIKAILLFVAFNYAFSLVPDSALWRVSLYNTVLPGKTRFPLEGNLDWIFGVHEITNSARQANEYKVVLLGDSSAWGYLLNPDQTFASLINASGMTTCKGQTVHVYNLGYPVPDVLRDALLMQRALTYKPDLVIWNVTLLSMFADNTGIRNDIIIKNNAALTQDLINKYKLVIGADALKGLPPESTTFLDRRDDLARFIQYQLNGIRWQATEGELVDQAHSPLGENVGASQVFDRYHMAPGGFSARLLHFDVMNAGILMAGHTPVVIVNEPIQIVNGRNSDIRYDEMYPRWIYDQYRQLMSTKSQQYHWNYLDLWNLLPPAQFTDSVFHRTPKGEQVYSRTMKDVILKNACP